METINNGNTLTQMEEYDFSTPINVTMIFDESDDENNRNSSNECYIIEDIIEIESINIIKNNKKSRKRARLPQKQRLKNTVNKDKVNTSDKDNVSDAVPNVDIGVINQQVNDRIELTSYVKDLLNTVSEHIIMIMHTHYYKFKSANTPEFSIHLKRLKTHFFDLSYSTVISLLLPQEKNDLFISAFIDKVVSDAYKILKKKCDRQEVIAIYNELIEWTKQKREVIKTLAQQQQTNDNRLLKERLAQPPVPFDSSHKAGQPLNEINNQNNLTTSEGNTNTCIFSYGNPGQEVRINVPSETINHPQLNQNISRYKKTPTSEIRAVRHFPPASHTIQREMTPYDTRMHNTQHNTYPQGYVEYHIPDRPPPAYCEIQSCITTAARPGNNVHNQIQENQWLFHQYQYGAQIEAQRASMPKTNPNLTSVANYRCCVCAKITNRRCSKCQNHFYCGNLCQELHFGVHKAVCKQKQKNKDCKKK